MFAAAPPLIGMLIRYWLIGEALKFATGTSKTDLAKAALDISEQIGNIYTSRIEAEMARPAGAPIQEHGLMHEFLTVGAGALGAPGTAAEALGYTFPGEFARQQQRLASEVRGGFPTTQVRIKGAPKFAKRKLSTWNREVKKAYKEVKAKKNQFGPKGKINNPKKAFAQVVKLVSKWHGGRKMPSSSGAKQIAKALKGLKLRNPVRRGRR